ncbi:MAG: hypothetical protein JHD16_01875 [Solirubrobacteraceae bacterium]|nr:hypothetical protein [Solirubrobacteraceae bacterium]
MWNPFSKGNRDEERPPQPMPQAPPILQTKPFAERMLRELEKTRWMARKSGDRLPVAALPQLGRIEDVLLPLLDHLTRHPPSVDEEIAVQGMVTDYLPTTLSAYIGLNPQFAQAVRDDGLTPADDLMAQLYVLESAAHDLSRAVYSHDAQELQTQGRFLSAKFERSDLAL